MDDREDYYQDQDQHPSSSQDYKQTLCVIGDNAIKVHVTENEMADFLNQRTVTKQLSLKPSYIDEFVHETVRKYDLRVLEPINMSKVLMNAVNSDALKVREILKQYKIQERQRPKKHCNPLTWIKDSLQTWSTKLNEEYDDPSNQSQSKSLIKGYDFNQSGEVVAILAKNECVYFYNLNLRHLVGSTLFNKKHYKSISVQYAPGQGDIVVVYGESGLVIWTLVNTKHFISAKLGGENEQNQQYKQFYKIWLSKEGSYQSITFSSSGRYLATIKKEDYDPNNTVIEVFDLFTTSNAPESFKVKRGLSSPIYISFSPLENHLLIGYRPIKNHQQLKILDLKTLYSDTWMIEDIDSYEKIASTIWSQDEAFLLVQLQNVSMVYLFTLKCSKLSPMEQESEIQKIQSQQSLKGQFLSYFNTFLSKNYSTKPLVYNMCFDRNYQLQEIVATKSHDRIIASYISVIEGDQVSSPQRMLAIYNLRFMNDQQCADIILVRKIEIFKDCIPIHIKVRYLNYFNKYVQKDQSVEFNNKKNIMSYIDGNRDSLNFVLISQ